MNRSVPNSYMKRRLSPESVINPFVPMSSSWRIAIVGYVLMCQTLPPLFSGALHGTEQVYPVTRALLIIGVDWLLLLPFLVRRLARIPTGWLHPLISPALMGWAIELMRTPEALLYPFLVWFEPVHQELSHPLLSGWSTYEVSLAQLKVEALTLLSLISIYAGFLLVNLPVPMVRLSPPRYIGWKVFAVLGLLGLLFLWLIQSSGGLVAHITSFGLGRQQALAGQGHIAGLIEFMPVVLILWYAFDRRLPRRPWYIVALLAALAIQFMTSGSRSATLFPLILLLAVWIFHHKRVPVNRVALLGIVGLIVFGVLGEIRTSSMGGNERADFSALTKVFNPTEEIETAQEQIKTRNRNSAMLPTIALAGEQLPLLWGRTYIAAFAFFIPSAIWQDKPRGAGAHVGAMVFGSRSLEQAQDYHGGGHPPGAVADAYWNFHVPGVVFIFTLYGIFKRWLVNILMRYRNEPAAIAFYLFSIFSVTSPTAVALTPYFRNTVFIGVFYYFLGVFRLRSWRNLSVRYRR